MTQCVSCEQSWVCIPLPHRSYNSLSVNTGIGLFFSAFMLGLTAVQARYTGFSPKSADEFNSASRSVKPGLIAAGIVSAWTWAATLVSLSSFSSLYHHL